jgi:hypothetical protein
MNTKHFIFGCMHEINGGSASLTQRSMVILT